MDKSALLIMHFTINIKIIRILIIKNPINDNKYKQLHKNIIFRN